MIKLKDLLFEENNDSNDRGGVLYCYYGKHLLCLGEASRKWNVPKGHIQNDETPLEGSVREFTEETQISLNGIPELVDSWKSKKGMFYLFKLEGTKKLIPRLDHEHTDWGYFGANELPSPMNEDVERRIKKQHNIVEGSPTGNVRGLKGYTGFIKSDKWNSKKKSLKKSVLKTTGYIMVDTEPIVPDKLDVKDNEINVDDVDDSNISSPKRHKELEKDFKKQISENPTVLKLKPLLERIDYQDSASQLIKQYGLKSKLKIGSGKEYGEYVPERDTITLRPSYKSVKQFLMSVLHEIGHALDAKRLGIKKYIKKYTQAGTMAAYDGLDPHDDNKWEEKAENFAKKELHKWL